MALSTKTRDEIKDFLVKTVREKLKSYKPETGYAPFQHRLLGKDKYATFSFIQSMNTTFGMSIWEQVATLLARNKKYTAQRQYKLLGTIDDKTAEVINEIHYKLRKGESIANKAKEVQQIQKSIKNGEAKSDPDSTVDFFVNIKGIENFFDITSTKPNMKEFVALKLKLLRWTALRLSQSKNVKVFTRLAIPYNPYYPDSYERWTLKGLYDLENGEILVGKEFWDFVRGAGTYETLLNVFQKAGEIIKPELDKTFANFK